MSLVAWFPLNGNISNHGCMDITPIQTNIPSFAKGGKTGKTLTTGAFKLSAADTAKVLHKTTSICLWIKALGDNSTDRAMIFGNSNMTAPNNRKFSLFQYPSANDFHWSWQTDDSSSTYAAGILYGALPKNTWVHVCATQDESSGRIRIYVNGELKKSYTLDIKNSTITFNNETQIVHNSAYHNICDLRIYDHELSVKEIREIMKGCILHYDFNNPAIGRQNLVTGDYACGYMNGSSIFSRVKKYDADSGYYYNYTLKRTGTGSNYWATLYTNNFAFTAGKIYYYSCKVRVNKANFLIELRASRSNNDWVTRMVNFGSSSADGQWHEYSAYQTINATYVRSGSTVTSNPVLEFYTKSLVTSGTVYECDFDVKDLQVVEAPAYMEYLPNGWTKSIIYDSSGFGNNGTIYGVVPIDADNTSPIGSYSAKFGGTANYISAGPAIDIMPTDSITVSAWAYLDNWNISTCMRVISCTEGGGWQLSLNDSSGYIGGPCYVSGAYMQAIYDRSKVSAGWHMMTLTFDGLNLLFYLDGVKVAGSTRSSVGVIQYNATAPLLISGEPSATTNTGLPWEGKIADIKIFASALSAADVLQLYNSKAQVSSNGVLFTNEFKETGSVVDITKNYVIKTKAITEDTSLSNKIKINKDGSITAKEIIEN